VSPAHQTLTLPERRVEPRMNEDFQDGMMVVEEEIDFDDIIVVRVRSISDEDDIGGVRDSLDTAI